ncbi:MAG: hypothetical protein WC989_03065 [Micavibrio sp.]
MTYTFEKITYNQDELLSVSFINAAGERIEMEAVKFFHFIPSKTAGPAIAPMEITRAGVDIIQKGVAYRAPRMTEAEARAMSYA